MTIRCIARLALRAAVACSMTWGFQPAYATNSYPVVLVHGFAGFGPGEMLGYHYFGGLVDIAAGLESLHPDQLVVAATVGPFSSNWDRAVELFYEIKGGCVDYGEAHSTAARHLRKPEDQYHDGRTCFPGLYPQWDGDHPVHLVSHSMGGQTARMLVQLLAAGGAPANPGLFGVATSARWVKSVTTIATPNDGTTLAYAITDWVPFVQQLVGGIAGLAGVTGDTTARVYDFKLDQWLVGPQAAGETFDGYVTRVMGSPFWTSGTTDLSPYDLSPAGAMAENAWVQDQPGVYYFSFATNSSYAGLFGWSYPDLDTNPLVATFAGPGFMGTFWPDGRPFPPVDPATWWPSDAVVNTVAQRAPTWSMDGAGNVYPRAVTIRDLTGGGAPQPGAWNWKGLMAGFDHLDVVGWTLFWDSVSWYGRHVDQLRSL